PPHSPLASLPGLKQVKLANMGQMAGETSSLIWVNTEDARQRRLIVSVMMRGILGRLHAARNESGERREPNGTSLLYRQADACRSPVVARMTTPFRAWPSPDALVTPRQTQRGQSGSCLALWMHSCLALWMHSLDALEKTDAGELQTFFSTNLGQVN
ncbi:MAG: hypothetical protein WCO86_19675, partial [Planctomycetota bacterium]